MEGLLHWSLGHPFPDFSDLTIAGLWVGAAHITVNGQDRAAVVWPGHHTIALVVGPSQPEAEAFPRRPHQGLQEMNSSTGRATERVD